MDFFRFFRVLDHEVFSAHKLRENFRDRLRTVSSFVIQELQFRGRFETIRDFFGDTFRVNFQKSRDFLLLGDFFFPKASAGEGGGGLEVLPPRGFLIRGAGVPCRQTFPKSNLGKSQNLIFERVECQKSIKYGSK